MLLRGEKEAIEELLKIGKTYGYGNCIAHLRRAWAKKLVAGGLDKKTAIEATNVGPYPLERAKL